LASKPALWRQTPPVIFPVCLGFIGISLALKNAAGVGVFVGVIPGAIGEIIMGMALAFFLYFFLAYVAKFLARPNIVVQDMKTPAGRAGISSIPMSFMLVGLVMKGHGMDGAPIWLVGVLLHSVLAVLAFMTVLKGQPGARVVTPFHYLTFVGLIVAPVAGSRLGYPQLSLWIAWYSLVPFTIITVLLARKLVSVRPPPPLRPALVIFLAPVGLFAIAFGVADMPVLFYFFCAMANLVLLVFLGLARWLTFSGYHASWSSFTFPAAVYANMSALAAAKTPLVPAEIIVWMGLLIGTPVVLFVVVRTTLAFIRGDLQKMSGAAVA